MRETMGERIKGLRTKWLKLSQRALGETIGATQKSINDWENNKYKPYPTHLANLAEACGVTVDYILVGSDDPWTIDQRSGEAKPPRLARSK